MNKIIFGEDNDVISDNGYRVGKIREARTGLGCFAITQTAPGRWWASLSFPLADGSGDGPAIWEDVFATKSLAMQACQEYYEGQARYILQEAFGADDDAPLILTGKQARHLFNTLWKLPGGGNEAQALQKIMDEQGVSR